MPSPFVLRIDRDDAIPICVERGIDRGGTIPICVEYRPGCCHTHLCRVSTGMLPSHLCRMLTGMLTSPFVSSIDRDDVIPICVKYRPRCFRPYLCRVSTGMLLSPFVSSIDRDAAFTVCVEYRLWQLFPFYEIYLDFIPKIKVLLHASLSDIVYPSQVQSFQKHIKWLCEKSKYTIRPVAHM